MPDDLDLAAMRAAAERAKDAPTATIRTLWFEGDADAEAHFNHIAAWSPARALALLARLERAAEAERDAARAEVAAAVEAARKEAYREGWNDREADFIAGAERTGMSVVGTDALAEVRKQARREGIEEIAAWIEPQRNDVPATGAEFAAAIRALLEDPSHG